MLIQRILHWLCRYIEWIIYVSCYKNGNEITEKRWSLMWINRQCFSQLTCTHESVWSWILFEGERMSTNDKFLCFNPILQKTWWKDEYRGRTDEHPMDDDERTRTQGKFLKFRFQSLAVLTIHRQPNPKIWKILRSFLRIFGSQKK